ncbi:AGAP005785-PA-like protein [Anopheles sinensis]|uniref:AGAP005785-PA-like protein n=1 Tax=Anopheles sinensis TaxID=74873 RepID=A0A084WEC4_ANOSI|nr:AGAP005785-PA-like protein [Anopheles sinensis]
MTSSRSIANRRIKINKVWVAFAVFGAISILRPASGRIVKRSYSDQSVRGYLTERTCWWNEVCKEEFQQLFRCRCPQWSYCRSPGRYYNAYCSMTNTGYIWTQPTWDWETA